MPFFIFSKMGILILMLRRADLAALSGVESPHLIVIIDDSAITSQEKRLRKKVRFTV
jgi:hypothetical protein